MQHRRNNGCNIEETMVLFSHSVISGSIKVKTACWAFSFDSYGTAWLN